MMLTSLTRRFLLWFVVISLIPLLLFGLLNLRENEIALKQQVLRDLSNQADRKAMQIRDYLFERVHDVRILAQDSDVRRLMKTLPRIYSEMGVDTPEYLQEEQSSRRLFSAFTEERGLFYDAFLITPQGEIIYTSKHEADFATNLLSGTYRESQLANAFNETRMTLEPSISDFDSYAPSGNAAAAFVTAPIVFDGVLLGVVALQLDTANVYHVAMDVNGLGKTGETVLGRLIDGNSALFVAPLRHDPQAALQRKVDLGSSAIPLLNALKGLRGSGVEIDYSGREVIAAWRYLPELRWGMVVKMDTDEAFASIHRQRILLMKTLLGLALVAGFFALNWGRDLVGKLQRFGKAADRIAEGDLNTRVEIAGGDEIATLANTFNRMADKLKNLYLFQEERIEERTRELSVTNEQLQEEVTERMRSEIELANSNSELLLYKRFMDASSNAMAMTKLDGSLIYGNTALFSLLAFSLDEYKNCNIHDYYAAEDVARITGEMRQQESWSGELQISDSLGKNHTVQNEMFVVKDTNGESYAFAMVMTDISARKLHQQALRQERDNMQRYLDTVQVMVVVLDTQGSIRMINPSAQRLLGYSAEELIGKHWFSTCLPQPEGFESVYPVFLKLMDGDLASVSHFENQVLCRDGSRRLIAWQSTFLTGEDGHISGILSSGIDVTDSHRVQQQLLHNQELLNEAQHLGKLGSWELDLVRGELSWSDEIYRIFELDPEQFQPSYERFLAAIHPDDRDAVNQAYARSLQDHLTYDIEHRLLMPDGRIKWVREHCSSDFGASGKPLRSVGAVQDITQQKFAEDQLRIAAATFETHEAIMITDANANILRVNRAFEETTGYRGEEVRGQNPRILSSGRQGKLFYEEMWQHLLDQGSWSGEMWDRRKSGQVYPKWLTITAVKNGQGAVTEYVAIFSDISDRKQAEEEIRHLAFYDALTQLPNRRLLLDRFHQALALSARSQSCGALLFLDMDRFKLLNDTLGHDYGDLMLIEVAARITDCVREVDTVARLGGDEFVVLIEEAGHDLDEVSRRIAGIAEKIRDSLAMPYQLKDSVHHSSPSIGVSLYRGDTETVDTLLKQADMAMYKAKESGRNAVRFFDPHMQQAVETRAHLESDLRGAIANGELELFYQIQVDKDFRPLGAEALIRWQHPLRGLVSPAQFIPIAEESSLILDIGTWVLEQGIRQLALWGHYKITRELSIAVNVSAAQFLQPNFVEQVAGILAHHGVDAARLKIELTESVVMNDVGDVVAKMNALKKLGVKLSMDDFGTGYSSLSYLKRLPLDQIKIDQSFVRDIATDSNDAVMVRAIIDLAQNFGLDVVAEGVETEVQHMFLKIHGCAAYQGYLFSKPVPIKEFEKLLGGLS